MSSRLALTLQYYTGMKHNNGNQGGTVMVTKAIIGLAIGLSVLSVAPKPAAGQCAEWETSTKYSAYCRRVKMQEFNNQVNQMDQEEQLRRQQIQLNNLQNDLQRLQQQINQRRSR
jgi:TolA-binding protein